MVTIACVLRSGGDFDASWVHALQRGVSDHLPLPHRFVCLSDVDVPCERIPLVHGWPGWWSKLELFRPGVFDGPVLYMDLDSLPVGDLSDVAAYRGPFAMLADFYRLRTGQKEGESGAMAWTPGEHTEAVYEAFEAKGPTTRGDGPFIRSHVAHEYLQDLYPGQVVSLKVHATKMAPEGARLVCGHGQPRLSSSGAGWAHELWKERAA